MERQDLTIGVTFSNRLGARRVKSAQASRHHQNSDEIGFLFGYDPFSDHYWRAQPIIERGEGRGGRAAPNVPAPLRSSITSNGPETAGHSVQMPPPTLAKVNIRLMDGVARKDMS